MMGSVMKLGYRPEIDGLRTIAVLAVIIYHAEFTFSSEKVLIGGFLGVDIFFVISGFLISSLMVSEFNKTGTISIIKFYERRAARLLPALFSVIIASSVLAWFYLLPVELLDYANSLITSLFFSSNIYWNYSSQQYGVESALLKPLMHTWSLAVEEQFYILYPLALIIIFRWYKKYVILLLTLAFILSLVFAEWMTHKDPSFSFYMLPSRLWEMLAGGIMAMAQNSQTKSDNSSIFSRAMPTVGFLLIIYSILSIDFNAAHPGFITLIPILGTSLIIWFADEKEPITQILSSKFFVSIGLISYSLYLWHYPIFAFGRIIETSPSINHKFIWLCLTLVSSLFSYFFIEKYFRYKISTLKHWFIGGVCAFAIIFIFGASAIIYHAGYPSRLPPILRSIDANVSDAKACDHKQLHCSINENKPKKLFIVGDSHMNILEKPILKYSIDNNYHYNSLNSIACIYLLNMKYTEAKTGNTFFKCDADLQNSRREFLLSSKPSIVILGGRFPYYLSGQGFNNQEGGIENQAEFFYQYNDNRLTGSVERNKAFYTEVKDAVSELLEHGHTVVIIYPIPEVGWHVPKVINTKLRSVPFFDVEAVLVNDPLTTSYNVYKERTESSFSLFDSIHHENLIRVYPHELFCDTVFPDRCVTHDSLSLFYIDDDHLSSTGANLLVEEIAKKIEQNSNRPN